MLILLGTAAAGVAQRHSKHLPWVWLAVFGFLQGLSQWLSLVAFSLGDGPLFAAVRFGVIVVSYLFLISLLEMDGAGSGPGDPDGGSTCRS